MSQFVGVGVWGVWGVWCGCVVWVCVCVGCVGVWVCGCVVWVCGVCVVWVCGGRGVRVVCAGLTPFSILQKVGDSVTGYSVHARHPPPGTADAHTDGRTTIANTACW